jgi:hypothetical protein
MDHSPPTTPPPPDTDTIGDETLSIVKWIAAHWPELGPWIAIGFVGGGGVVLTAFGAPILAGETLPKWVGAFLVAIGPAMATAALVAVHFARPSYLKQEDRKRRKARAEKHDEMIGHVESETAICVEQFRANRLLREELIEERKAIRAVLEKEYADALNLSEIELRNSWTPDAVKERVSIGLASARFTDTDTPECALLIRWKVVSIVGIPHQINFLGGKCEARALASTGSPIVYLDLRPLPSLSFDGKLSPDELSLRGVDDKAVIDAAQRAQLRAAFQQSEAVKLTIFMKCDVMANGNAVSIDVVVESYLIEPTAWMRKQRE